MSPYLLWDWNGTLLDDTRACLDALNLLLARRRLPAIDLAYYRANFAFPARAFYAAVGVRLELEDWNSLAQEYHDAYGAQPKALNVETRAALELARAAGCRQAIISALREDLLAAAAARCGVTPYMEHVFGTDNLDGGSKLARARELLAAIRPRPSLPTPPVVLIGDSLHDKEVADDLG